MKLGPFEKNHIFCAGPPSDGWRDGDSDGNGGDGRRGATAMDGATATQRQGTACQLLNGDGQRGTAQAQRR